MKRKVNFKWFALVSVFIFLIDAAFVYINHISAKEVLIKDITQQVDSMHNTFDTTLDIIGSNMQQIATYIASQQIVQDYFYQGVKAVNEEGGGPGGRKAARFRRELFDHVKDSWGSMRSRFDVRQLHFHMGPGSTSYLRVHRPEKFGDNMDHVRYTIVDANKYQKIVKGFETGRVYSGIRGVTPVYHTDPKTGEKVHIGALEAGTSFTVMIETLKKTTGADLAVMLTSRHMEENMWKANVDKRYKESPPIDGFGLEYATDMNVLRILREDEHSADILHKGAVDIVNDEGKFYYLSSFGFRDYKNIRDEKDENIGVVVIRKDITGSVWDFEKNTLMNITFAVFGFLIIEVLLYYTWYFSSRKLMDTIDSKTEELEAALKENLKKEQLLFQQKKFADMGKMISAIAHQWRQPLSALGMYAQDVADAYRMGDLDSKYMDDFEKTQVDLVVHLSNTINDFSDFFKPEKEEKEFEIVAEVICVMKLILAQFNKRKIDINITCSCEDHSFSCENTTEVPDCEFHRRKLVGFQGEFKQALLNLLYNAADAVEESLNNGVIERGVVHIVISGDEKYITIDIRDNGPGVPDEILADIFNPYFTTKSEGKGTGIGLYMTKMVVEDHMKGSVSAVNSSEGGAIFTIKLRHGLNLHH